MEAAQHRLVSRWLSNEARAVCEAGALFDGCGCTGAELSKALLEAFAGLPSRQSAAVLARAFTAAGVSENSSRRVLLITALVACDCPSGLQHSIWHLHVDTLGMWVVGQRRLLTHGAHTMHHFV